MAELSVHDPLPEDYWESLGMEGEQAKASDPFSDPPPGEGDNPFTGGGGPSGRSRYQAGWLRTYGGVEFIDVFVGEVPGSDDTHMLIFLHEVLPGRYNVCFSRPRTIRGGEVRYQDVGYEEGKRHAELEAMAMSVDAGANADWRQDVPGIRQESLATRMGIDFDPKTVSKGELSDKLNVHFASRTLDPTFAKRS